MSWLAERGEIDVPAGQIGWYIDTMLYIIGCNNGGGGGFFPKVMQWVEKQIGTRKQLLWRKKESSAQKREDFLARHVSPIQSPYICWVHGFLEYARSFGFKPISGRQRSILSHSAFLRYGIKLAMVLICIKDCVFWNASWHIVANNNKICILDPRKVTSFVRNPFISPKKEGRLLYKAEDFWWYKIHILKT